MSRILVWMMLVVFLPVTVLGANAKRPRRVAQPDSALPAVSALLSVPVWTPIGPDPIPNGQTGATQLPVSGRVLAIAVDPTDANIVYAGTAGGGLNRTLDGGATWTPLMDSALTSIIGAITIDPTDRNILFVGTGESNFALDSFFGDGVYVIRGATTATPSLSGPFHSDGVNDIFTGRSISRILVNPNDHNKILVASASAVSGVSGQSFNILPERGVYFSTNALSAAPTFTRLAIPPGMPLISISDMAMDPANPAVVVVSVRDTVGDLVGGLWTADSDPWTGTATWTLRLSKPGTIARLAVNKDPLSPSGTFFAAFDEPSSCAGSTRGTLRKSVDGGVTWPLVAAANGFCGPSCFYAMVIGTDPTNVNNLYLGGSIGNGIGTCRAGILGRSVNGGAMFSSSQNFLHAYTHAIAVAPSNGSIVYTGNDGGIFRSSDSGGTWSSINTPGFNALILNTVSVHPTDRNFTLGAANMNGAVLMDAAGNWRRSDFGDAGSSAIDQNATDTTSVTLYHTYFSGQGLLGYAHVTGVANPTEANWVFSGCSGTPANGIGCIDQVLHYAPLALGPGIPNSVYYGTDRLYRSSNQGTLNVVVSQVPIQLNVPISAIAISPQDDNVRLVGLKNGTVFKTTTGSVVLGDITGTWGARYVSKIAIDPNDGNIAYIALNGYGFATHVWKITNVLAAAAPTWIAASDGLPDVPVNALAVNPSNSNFVFAGTDIGVFASIDGGAAWSPYGNGLPRVPVFDLAVQNTSQILRIATHGRGMWETRANPFVVASGMHGDFNGDGHADVLIRDSIGTIGMWLMNGSAITGGAAVANPGGSYTVAGVGDFNGDGKSDVLLRDNSGTLGLWFMNGATITSGALIGSPGGTYTVAAVADFNGDGKADILLRDDLGNLGMWIMNGATIASGALVGSPGSYTVAATGDFNGDGKADILLRDNLGTLGVWIMNGATIASGALVGSPGGTYSVAAAADFNGDGKCDIVLRDNHGMIGMWIMNGPVITAGALVGSPGVRYTVIAAADFDGNNRGDMMLRNSATGDVGMWLMNGSTIASGGAVSALATSSEVVP
jgi:uncharacterized protein (DUF2141 family)